MLGRRHRVQVPPAGLGGGRTTSPPSWFQYVRIVFLRSEIDAESPPATKRILVDRHSKFKDLKDELAADNLDHWTLLQSHYTSPIPFWSESDPNATLNIERQTVYAINTNGMDYVLGVVRTSNTDYPMLLLDPQTPQTVRQVVSTDPVLADVKSITLYSGALDIGAPCWIVARCERLSQVLSQRCLLSLPENLDMSLESAFAYLQTSYLDYQELLRESFRLNFFALQMIHVSRCLIHVLVSLAQALGPPDSVPASIDDWTDQAALDLFHIAYLLDYELRQYHADLRGYWSAIKKDEFDREDIQRNIDRIFLALCGDYPGAVTVRHSLKHFEELKELDQETLDPQGSDGLEEMDPRMSYPSVDSGCSSDHSLNLLQEQRNDGEPRGDESGSDHSSDEGSLEQENPNDGTPEYHSARYSGVTAGEPPIAAQDEVHAVVTEAPTLEIPAVG